jgi:hypothetical protein
MATILKEDARYGELIIDSFFSRDESATKVDNVVSNRPIMHVDGLAVHQAKIPLTYDTIFSPYNIITYGGFTYTGATASAGTVYTGSMIRTLPNGSPTALNAQAFFTGTAQILGPSPLGGLSSPYGLFAAATEIRNAGNTNAHHTAILTLGLNTSGTGFNIYVVVQTAPNVTADNFQGTFTITYPAYIGRKLGLPDGGSWQFRPQDYPYTETLGAAVPANTVPYINLFTSPPWNTGIANEKLGYYTVTTPFNYEMNMGRYLVLRGNLAAETQSMVHLNNEEAQNSDILAILPINGAYGDVMLYNSPNFEIFKLARTISIRMLKLWFTRGEDPSDTPINFKGVDYWLKLALVFRDESASRTLIDSRTGGFGQSTAKRVKLSDN